MSVCPCCATNFSCAMADQTGKPCWCTEQAPIPFAHLPAGKLALDASCFCPNCLPEWKKERERQTKALPNDQTEGNKSPMNARLKKPT